MHNAQAIDECIIELYDICQKHTDKVYTTFLKFQFKEFKNKTSRFILPLHFFSKII